MLHGLYVPSPSLILPGLFTVDTLPNPAANVDMYARVTDLFGGKRDLVLASQDANGAYWQPVRPDYKGNVVASADMTLVPLKYPSILSLTGSVGLGTTRTISLGTQMVFPGARFTIRTKLSSLLGNLKVLDGLTSTLYALAVNTSYDYIYDANNGWEQF